MAYDDRSVYNKYPLTSADGSSDDCNSCGDSSGDCSCCPVGTVGVYNEKGEHVGCLTPNDAEIYNNALHVPVEGYVKVIDPTTGKYMGDLPPAQAIDFLNYISNAVVPGTSGETFNIVTPELAATGFYELNYQLADGITGDIDIQIDRVGITDAVTLSIQNSIEDIQFDPSGTISSIPLGDSNKTVKFKWTGIAVAGVYTFILRFATTNVVKELPIRLTLS